MVPEWGISFGFFIKKTLQTKSYSPYFIFTIYILQYQMPGVSFFLSRQMILFHEMNIAGRQLTCECRQCGVLIYLSTGVSVYLSAIGIGVEFYWEEYKSKISETDRKLIQILRELLSPKEFQELAIMVKEKNGTPDLLLIKNNKISFVEVKYNYETVKSSTVEFFLRYGHKWPISILRIVRKT